LSGTDVLSHDVRRPSITALFRSPTAKEPYVFSGGSPRNQRVSVYRRRLFGLAYDRHSDIFGSVLHSVSCHASHDSSN